MKSKLFYGWVIAMSSFVITMSIGLLNSYGIFFLPLRSELNLSSTEVSSIYSFAILGETVGSAIGGSLTDRHDPRLIGVSGAAVLSAGLVLSGLASNITGLYLGYSALAGLGWGILVVVPSVIVVQWFVKRRGLAVGIATAGSGAGTLLFSPVIYQIIRGFGWRVALMGLGIAIFPFMIVCSLLIIRNPGRWSLGDQHEDSPGAPSASPRQTYSFGEAMRATSFWTLYSSQLLGSVSLQAFLVYVVPYSIHSGISEAGASSALAVVGIFSVIGRIGMGPVSDRLGRSNALAVVYLLISVGVLLLSLASNLFLVYTVSVMMGLALGGIISGNLTAVGDIFESESLGRIIGIQSSAFGLGGIIGPIASGFVLDSLGDYHPVFWIASACALAATVVAILLARKMR